MALSIHTPRPPGVPGSLDEALTEHLAWLSATPELDTPDALAEARARALRVRAFLSATPAPFHRETLPGHVTGSALLVDASWSAVCLMHHTKLGLWLQPGGHSDGCPLTWEVARREAEEETGLEGLRLETFTSSGRLCPVDIDIHVFPARGGAPEHLHFDVRFLVVSPRAAAASPLTGNAESRAVAWFPIAGGERPNTDDSVLRLFRRAAFLASRKEPAAR